MDNMSQCQQPAITGTVMEIGLFATAINDPDNVLTLVGPVLAIRPY